MVKNERGLSLIIFVFMMMVTTTVIVAAYGFLIIYEQRSGGIELNEQKALYIAETGIERAMEYLEDDTDWSDNDGIAVISENFGAGSYSVDLSNGTRTTIVLTSEAAVDSGPRQVTRKIRQKIRRLPEAFNYALFWNGVGSCIVDRGDVDINGGDVFTKGSVTSADPGTIDVAGSGTPALTNGGFVYTTNSWTANGTYTEGIKPNDEPIYPVLDTTFYDSEIATAQAQTAGDLIWTGGSQVLNGTIYVNGEITIDGTVISGKGALAANGSITIEGASSITPDSGEFIRLIAKKNATIKDTTVTAEGTLVYARSRVRIEGVAVRGIFISEDELEVKKDATVTGYIYTDILKIHDDAAVNGSIVTNSYLRDKFSKLNKTVTINFDFSYFEEAAPGLGLDIDGDANEEGIIVKVPGTWEQL